MAKILLVEDDNNLREIYQARLQAEGYNIVSARDGEEALVVAKAEKPDLVIADVMMPKISGFEMLDILRNTDGLKDVKVIMLTALGQSDDQQRADKLGADRYLVKSQVTLEDIVKTTRDLLGEATGAAEGSADDAATPAATDDKPAPASDPAPATEPAAEPAETPAAETPKADDQPSTAAPVPAESGQAASDAPSTKEEEASVDAKIEDFVAGATTEASSPAAPAPQPEPAEPTPAPPTEPPKEEEKSADSPVPTPDPAAAANDDKLMSDAVDTLVASTEKEEPDQAKAETVIQPTTETPEPAPADEPPKEEEKSDNVTVAHKKVIEPIDSEPKKDIDTLLAAEEAKETDATPAAGDIVVSGEDDDKPKSPPDPSTIAL